MKCPQQGNSKMSILPKRSPIATSYKELASYFFEYPEDKFVYFGILSHKFKFLKDYSEDSQKDYMNTPDNREQLVFFILFVAQAISKAKTSRKV